MTRTQQIILLFARLFPLTVLGFFLVSTLSGTPTEIEGYQWRRSLFSVTLYDTKTHKEATSVNTALPWHLGTAQVCIFEPEKLLMRNEGCQYFDTTQQGLDFVREQYLSLEQEGGVKYR